MRVKSSASLWPAAAGGTDVLLRSKSFYEIFAMETCTFGTLIEYEFLRLAAA